MAKRKPYKSNKKISPEKVSPRDNDASLGLTREKLLLAYAAHAKAIRKPVEALTKEDKQTALLNWVVGGLE